MFGCYRSCRSSREPSLSTLTSISPGGACPCADREAGAGPASLLPATLRRRRFLQIFTDFYRSLEGSFSAGSTATIATKYSFFQVFRDLQNYLAKFSKICKILQKISDFRKNQHFFCKNPEISQNFCNFLRFFAKFCNFFKKSAR